MQVSRTQTPYAAQTPQKPQPRKAEKANEPHTPPGKVEARKQPPETKKAAAPANAPQKRLDVYA